MKISRKTEERIPANVPKFQKTLAVAKARDLNESHTVVIITDLLAEVFGYEKYATKRNILLAVLLLVNLCHAQVSVSETRTWTPFHGRGVLAWLQYYTNGVATLRKDGITYRFKDADLSDSDRQYLAGKAGVTFTMTEAVAMAEAARKVKVREAEAKRLKTVDISALYGRTAQELRQIFPSLPATAPARSASIEGWRGWKTVYFGFNNSGRLASLNFAPAQPMSEEDAKRSVSENFLIELADAYEKKAPAVIAYRDMPGRIRTVNLTYVDWKKDDHRISDIGVFFSIGWEE